LKAANLFESSWIFPKPFLGNAYKWRTCKGSRG